jgi:hypothetical protein
MPLTTDNAELNSIIATLLPKEEADLLVVGKPGLHCHMIVFDAGCIEAMERILENYRTCLANMELAIKLSKKGIELGAHVVETTGSAP